MERSIEEIIDEPMVTTSSADLGKVTRIDDAQGRYIEFCKSTIPSSFNLNGMKVVLDCAHGATYHVAPSVFRELGADVVTVGTEPDGLNINEEVGSTSPRKLQAKVLEVGADLGIAFDGDGDRVLFVDHHGAVVDGDELLYVIARDCKRTSGECSGVVGTLMTNLGCELALKEMDVPFSRAKVGDRYVIAMMKEQNWLFGGESSGHIICGDVTTTGDGLVAALKVMFAIASEEKTLHEIKSGMKKFPQTMINVRIRNEVDLATHECGAGSNKECRR